MTQPNEVQTVATVESPLIIRLPAGATELHLTRAGVGRLLDAATRVYIAKLPTDDVSVTLHLAMKQAARMLLWAMSKRRIPGWAEVPKLTRKDDAVAVVLRYMLENMFGEAIARSGGTVDVGAAVGAAQLVNGTTIEGDYGELISAVAGLVSGPEPEPTGEDVSRTGSAA